MESFVLILQEHAQLMQYILECEICMAASLSMEEASRPAFLGLLCMIQGLNTSLLLTESKLLCQMVFYGSLSNRHPTQHQHTAVDVYAHLKVWPMLFWRMTRHTVDEFEELLSMLKTLILFPRNIHGKYGTQENIHRRMKHAKLTVENRLLLILIWLTVYPTYPVLSYAFGVDCSVISLVWYF